MIIECEQCKTKFNLDQSLLQPEGSKVRCSRCRHVFTAYPEDRSELEEAETLAVRQDTMTETSPLDSSQPRFQERADMPGAQGDGAEDTFEESVEELDQFEAVSPEDLHELLRDEPMEEGPPPGDYREEEAGWSGMEEPPIEKRPQAKAAAKPTGRSRTFLVVLLIILLLITAGAAVFVWAPGIIPDSIPLLKPAEKADVADLGVRRLSFKGVTGSFVESEDSGQLFVIQGMVRNDYPKTRSFILVKGTILDGKGEVVKRKLAYAGNSIEEQRLEEMPFEEIDRAMKNRHGQDRKNVNIPPGASIPFTIVFEKLPEDLGEFTVEAVRSSPGA